MSSFNTGGIMNKLTPDQEAMGQAAKDALKRLGDLDTSQIDELKFIIKFHPKNYGEEEPKDELEEVDDMEEPEDDGSGMQPCPKCDAESAGKFCPECGTRMPMREDKEEDDMEEGPPMGKGRYAKKGD